MVRHFAEHGLTLADYLRAAIKNRRLFGQVPETIQSNIESVVRHFAAEGLTLTDYLRAALQQPQLFSQTPATIQSNVETVVRHFATHGLTVGDYLHATLRKPSLFAMAPATIIRHVHCLIDMQREGLLTLPDQQDTAVQPLRSLFRFLLRNPLLMTLADDNLAMHIGYARLTGRRLPGTALLTRTRWLIEKDFAHALGVPASELHLYLGHLDSKPIP